MVFHDLQGFGGEHLGARGFAVYGHHLIDAGLAHIDAAIQGAAQVAVGEDPGQATVIFHHHGHAQAFLGHFQQGVA